MHNKYAYIFLISAVTERKLRVKRVERNIVPEETTLLAWTVAAGGKDEGK